MVRYGPQNLRIFKDAFWHIVSDAESAELARSVCANVGPMVVSFAWREVDVMSPEWAWLITPELRGLVINSCQGVQHFYTPLVARLSAERPALRMLAICNVDLRDGTLLELLIDCGAFSSPSLVDLSVCNVVGEGGAVRRMLEAITSRHLMRVDISGLDIEDGDLQYLCGLLDARVLELLDVSRTGIADPSPLFALLGPSSNLRVLTLCFTMIQSFIGLVEHAMCTPKLMKLLASNSGYMSELVVEWDLAQLWCHPSLIEFGTGPDMDLYSDMHAETGEYIAQQNLAKQLLVHKKANINKYTAPLRNKKAGISLLPIELRKLVYRTAYGLYFFWGWGFAYGRRL